jgi:hypothetical protein
VLVVEPEKRETSGFKENQSRREEEEGRRRREEGAVREELRDEAKPRSKN